jgi:hypothetical protein
MNWPFRRYRDQDITEEIWTHLEMAAHDRIAAGEPPDDARANASPGLLYELTPTDLTTFVAVTIALVLLTLVACLVRNRGRVLMGSISPG